jgi:hypothetical protein
MGDSGWKRLHYKLFDMQSLDNFSIEPRYTITLENSNLPAGIDSFWVMLKSSSGTVEGKLFLQKNLTKLVIFEPGFPGGGSTQFEQLWLDSVLADGYSVFLARHSGTLVQGKYAGDYINCPQRQNLQPSGGLLVLGTRRDSTIADWLTEPLIALEVLSTHFSEIVLCGHSFGPLALIKSLQRFVVSQPKLAEKIYRVVSLSGSIGRVRNYESSILKIWHDHLNTDWARERVLIGDANLNTVIFGRAHEEINKNARTIPEQISFIAVVPCGDTENSVDEIVNPWESVDFINSLGRGYLIVDKLEWGDKSAGRMVHDMEALQVKDLLNFLSKNWSPVSQISVIS